MSTQNATQERLQYAIRQLEQHNIEFCLKSDKSGHIHCRKKSDDKLIQFWTGTGKIMGYENERGVHSLVKILTEA